MYITFDEIMSYKMKVEGLQADNKRLNDKDGLYDEVKELQAENKALDEQVSSNSHSNSNTIQREIAEYVSHNDGCGGARLFLIPRDEFKNDEYDETIYWDDGLE